MPEQVLVIEPEHELKFKGPFNLPSTTLLKLSNPSGKRVVFKIKTTAPKRYCVRPNAGLLEPGTSSNIAVVFQPCELEPAGYKHKFMVQALYAPEGEVNMDALWKDVDNTKLMDTKLRCTFETSTGADTGSHNDEDVEIVKAANVKLSEGDAASDGEPGVSEFSDTSAYLSNASPEDNRGGDATARVQQEERVLRKENVHLKEELERLKRQLKSRESSGPMGSALQSASPPAIPMVYIVLTLVAVLIGLIMGKFML